MNRQEKVSDKFYRLSKENPKALKEIESFLDEWAEENNLSWRVHHVRDGMDSSYIEMVRHKQSDKEYMCMVLQNILGAFEVSTQYQIGLMDMWDIIHKEKQICNCNVHEGTVSILEERRIIEGVPKWNELAVGISKCSSEDQFNRLLGRVLAKYRACKKFGGN